jgi:hypothetical protein
MNPTHLEHLIEEVAARSTVGTISVAISKIAEEIAQEALADPTFRSTIRTLVQRRSQALLAQLLAEEEE